MALTLPRAQKTEDLLPFSCKRLAHDNKAMVASDTLLLRCAVSTEIHKSDYESLAIGHQIFRQFNFVHKNASMSVVRVHLLGLLGYIHKHHFAETKATLVAPNVLF